MKSLTKYLNESYSSIKNWRDVENALKEFIEEANLEPMCDNPEDNNIDEILSSFEEWLIELYDIRKQAAKSILKHFNSNIRKWFFDNGIVESA